MGSRLDPTKVTRSALQKASLKAGLMVTSEAMVAEAPKKEEPASGDHSGGSGMSGVSGVEF